MCSIYSSTYTNIKHFLNAKEFKNWVYGGKFIKHTKQSSKSASTRSAVMKAEGKVSVEERGLGRMTFWGKMNPKGKLQWYTDFQVFFHLNPFLHLESCTWNTMEGAIRTELTSYRIHCMYFSPTILRFLEKAMAPHSSPLAWKIPWTEEPGRLQSLGSQRVRHDWGISLSLFTFVHWRRKWQPTPVFLPGESQGWGRTEPDTTEVT